MSIKLSIKLTSFCVELYFSVLAREIRSVVSVLRLCPRYFLPTKATSQYAGVTEL